ncbi:hypothetical protein CJ255_07055 [Candidatus Viridilinea mediisalina]|uniref:Uncharacterized protein n=1 Tax=Candidatus Viridilinea mediisalina TaxID=2024553 RepID=A0A2A6RLN1_9CHLR|nr:hypothetical protein CJ255_07055 [Candidatus Viridilinea mediisalina]
MQQNRGVFATLPQRGRGGALSLPKGVGGEGHPGHPKDLSVAIEANVLAAWERGRLARNGIGAGETPALPWKADVFDCPVAFPP